MCVPNIGYVQTKSSSSRWCYFGFIATCQTKRNSSGCRISLQISQMFTGQFWSVLVSLRSSAYCMTVSTSLTLLMKKMLFEYESVRANFTFTLIRSNWLIFENLHEQEKQLIYALIYFRVVLTIWDTQKPVKCKPMCERNISTKVQFLSHKWQFVADCHLEQKISNFALTL